MNLPDAEIIRNLRAGTIDEERLARYLLENLTTHVARRTYATMLLNRGVRIETVSKCMGHRNSKITQAAYAEVLNSTVIKEVKSKL